MNIFARLYRKMFPLVLHGSRYPWTATVEGNDIVVTGQGATWFGGDDDPQDDGSTASGMSTKSNPQIMGCALPLDYGTPLSKENPCQGSPLKKIPWFTNVVVTNRANHASVTVKLIDLGPSAPPAAHAAIDLTQEAFTTLGGDLKAGRLLVDFRIINGAKLLNLV